jgi:hypothetical protein
MKKKLLSMAAIAMLGAVIACQQDEKVAPKTEISQEVLNKIQQLGFSTQDVIADGDGYIVERDIKLHDHDLNSGPIEQQVLRIAETEQYRTYNVVARGSGRTITVKAAANLPVVYQYALDEAIGRFNNLRIRGQGLYLKFSRIPSSSSQKAEISIVGGSGGFLASAGFPQDGNPYNRITVNTSTIGNQSQATIATILAHEIGHCIGYRHTDYMNRAYSCGGSPSNEGAGSIGAVHIPGTPSGPDAGSWMLACIGNNQVRHFNANDIKALDHLY